MAHLITTDNSPDPTRVSACALLTVYGDHVPVWGANVFAGARKR